jgi:hypothetical protein
MAIRNDFAPGEVLAAADLNDTFGSKLPIAGGKILQIVRATDATDRSTTSTSFVDASISVTITPQKSDSAILLFWAFVVNKGAAVEEAFLQITDASNNGISGANNSSAGTGAANFFIAQQILIGYATPATTSATTYKGRFRSALGTTLNLFNSSRSNGQLYAIEVSA